jgi:acyl-CoA thioester hydrolase
VSKPERPEHAVEVFTRVAFHHCDPLAVAWHGRYFEWLEEARAALFASVGLEVHQIQALGHRMYMVEARCRYMAPLRYAERVRILAWFGAARPLIRVGYDLYNAESGRWSARASTVLAVTDRAGELLPSTPDAILERLPVR